MCLCAWFFFGLSVNIDAETNNRVAKASAAFGRLREFHDDSSMMA
jgi:hypothetical protein